MLNVADTGWERTCSGVTRRDLLRIGGLGLGGLTLPGMLAARARAAAGGTGALVRDKSVVLLFLQGGPSHIEFFDPKMTAPAEVRSITGEISTRLPGVTFGGTFPKLARLADRLAVVRSFASENGSHDDVLSVAGVRPLRASMGSLYARIAGPTRPDTGLPRASVVFPEAVGAGKLGNSFETKVLSSFGSPGGLGASFAGFDPGAGGQLRDDLTLRLPRERFADRRSLLDRLDALRRRFDADPAVEGLDAFQRQAYDVILRGMADAFDLSKENPRVVERYDTSAVFKAADLQKFGDMRRTTNLLGRQMLLARRLCEAGCGFVTVVDGGWDMHANNNSPKNMAGLPLMTAQVDHAVSAFLEDVESRGLSDRILLVITGEMGRTPKLNKNGGRDHWGNLTTLAFAGGGLNMGQVIGRSDRLAGAPATEKYNPANLLATLMHVLFDVNALRTADELPKAVLDAATAGKPIPELF